MAGRSTDITEFESNLPNDIARTSARLILTRWFAGALVILATGFCAHALRLPLPEAPLYALGAAILGYNAAFRGLSLRKPSADPARFLTSTRRLVILQVGLDWLSMSVFLHLTGGVSSPAVPFFLIHMLMVTILLPGRSSYVYVTLGVLALTGLAVLEATGALPHYTVIPSLPSLLYRDPTYLVAQILFFASAAYATVALAASIVTQLHERDRQISALYRTTRAVSSTLSLSDVLGHLVRSAAEALSTSRASIRLLDETGERLRLVAAYGLSEAYRDKGPVEVSRNPLARAALSGQAVIVRDAASDPRLQYPRQVLDEGISSILIVPITGRARPLGVLRVYAPQSNRFTPVDAEFVMAIARQGAVAIENAMAHEALQRADQERAQFVRTVTHELRAPVGGAQSLLRVLLRGIAGTLSDQQREIVRRVEARLNALTELIQDLLALAATKTAGFQEAPEPLPLYPALAGAVEALAEQATERRIALQLETGDQGLTVRATRDGLAQIFGNLVGNAVKYTADGGAVTVRLASEGATASVVVADNGIGIPADDMHHLWEEFFRAHNARASGIVGTGLGLSIVKRLVESFDGLISVQSTEGQGTTFTVTLPLVATTRQG